MTLDANNDTPYFLEWGKDYPIWDDQSDYIDRKLEWYFCGEAKRSAKELIEVKKQIKKSLREKAKEVKQKNPKLRIASIVNDLWNKEYNRFKWQRKYIEKKYVNNLEYVFNQVFCELANRANYGDKSNQELKTIFDHSANIVSSRMEGIIERNAFKSELQYPLPKSWNEGKKLLTSWLIQDLSEFNFLKVEIKKEKNLQDKLKEEYGLKKINDNSNNISSFAKEIYSGKKFKKSNGEYYCYESIKRELYNLIGRKE
jgi:hypothetical protein